MLQTPTVPVSWGELLDKMTILEIKQDRLTNAAAIAHVAQELRMLRAIGLGAMQQEDVRFAVGQLRRVNETLWHIEDAIRQEEARAQFGAPFIRLARSVYRMNDRRAAIKRRINELLQSELVEEKGYASFVMPHRPAPSAAGAAA